MFTRLEQPLFGILKVAMESGDARKIIGAPAWPQLLCNRQFFARLLEESFGLLAFLALCQLD